MEAALSQAHPCQENDQFPLPHYGVLTFSTGHLHIF
jgi:hypothetical protein